MELVEKTIPVKIGSRTFLKLIAPVASLFVESQWVVEFNFPLFRGLHFLGTTVPALSIIIFLLSNRFRDIRSILYFQLLRVIC